MIKIFNLTIARLLIYSFLEIYQRVFVGTHDMLTRLLQRATFMQRFVQSNRLLKELKLTHGGLGTAPATFITDHGYELIQFS